MYWHSLSSWLARTHISGVSVGQINISRTPQLAFGYDLHIDRPINRTKHVLSSRSVKASWITRQVRYGIRPSLIVHRINTASCEHGLSIGLVIGKQSRLDYRPVHRPECSDINICNHNRLIQVSERLWKHIVPYWNRQTITTDCELGPALKCL